MDNLHIYNQARTVPQEALKEIKGGRLNGKSDINPMWRIKKLTELFGMCGVGWKYVITKQWLENGAGGEISAFVNIDLFVRVDGEWSEAIPGTGGSAFVANEKNGPYTSDECFKMALTDAISVACKALGFGADVYWDKDKTKYSNKPLQAAPEKQKLETPPVDWPRFWAGCKKLGYTQARVHEIAGESSISHYTREQAGELFKKLESLKQEEKQSA
jgi:hypothetical protein